MVFAAGLSTGKQRLESTQITLPTWPISPGWGCLPGANTLGKKPYMNKVQLSDFEVGEDGMI
jgi:hypothetical protein